MEIKLNENTIVKVENNKAEIISDKTYRLTIFLDKNKVIASYSNMSLIIEFDKFDIEKLARKIFSIVRTTHKFSIITIQKVLLYLPFDSTTSWFKSLYQQNALVMIFMKRMPHAKFPHALYHLKNYSEAKVVLLQDEHDILKFLG